MLAVTEEDADMQVVIIVEPCVGIAKLLPHRGRQPVAFFGPVDAHEKDLVALFDTDLTFRVSLCHGHLGVVRVGRNCVLRRDSGNGVAPLGCGFQVILGARQLGTHRPDGDMGRAEFAPGSGVFAPTLGIAAGDLCLRLDAKACWIAPGFLEVSMDLLDGRLGLFARREERQPAVADADSALEQSVGLPPNQIGILFCGRGLMPA
jgi:hypothetical protein